MTLALAALLSFFAQDYPSLSDRNRFPDHETARVNLEIAREYKEFCRHRASISPRPHPASDYWRSQMEHAERVRNCWDWLHAAQGGEGRDEEYWRKSLDRLRELLGPEDYYAGRMPCLP